MKIRQHRHRDLALAICIDREGAGSVILLVIEPHAFSMIVTWHLSKMHKMTASHQTNPVVGHYTIRAIAAIRIRELNTGNRLNFCGWFQINLIWI